MKHTLCFALIFGLAASNSVTFNAQENFYEDLLVAISPDVPNSESEAVIANIKEWITQGSEVLYNATYGWAYFKSVKILLPATWENVKNVTTAKYEAFEDAEVRVETQNPIHGNFPFSVQNGGCGDPGQYVQTSSEYFTKSTESEANIGPYGQIFVHNWAKLRYGVFEEFGYPGDKLYPMFYYKQVWTAEGQTNTLKPNLCSNMVPEGSEIDNVNGGSCSFDTKTGLPDSNCVYVAGGPATLTSSVMGIPYLQGNNKFCDDTEEQIHNPDIPTKHNDICDGQSVFSVIQKHTDFTSYAKKNLTKDTTPTFTLLRPGKSQEFVLVLDTSKSMRLSNRIGRVKEAAKRFLELDIGDNVPVGIVQFSAKGPEETRIVQEIVPVNDTNRPAILDLVDGLTLHLDTCLGNGLKMGLQALTNYGVTSGGVMIFLTDGQYYCPGGLTIEDVIEEVVGRNVRVITIAFGVDAQQNIEDLAKRTGGRAYFVNDDTGPEDLNNALSGALAFQPSTKSENKEIIILQKTFSYVKNIQEAFSIDQYIGRDLILEVDLNSTAEVTIETNVSGENKTHTFTSNLGVFNQSIPTVTPGNYFINVFSNTEIAFATIKIKSKAPSGVLPLTVECWTSIGGDALDLIGENPEKIAVMAKVTQGQNPIIGAKVMATLDMGKGPVELLLSDEGMNPDTIKGDGIYARYFTKFAMNAEETRYTLKCDVAGTNTSMVNQGAGSLRSSRTSSPTPPCCGSSAVSEDSVLAPSGMFSRSESGGIVIVGSTRGLGSNIYPPGKINDLSLGSLDFVEGTFEVSFTSTGGDLDDGVVASNQLFFSANQTLISRDLLDEAEVELVENGFLAGNFTFDPLPASEVVRLPMTMGMFNVSEQYYFRIKATDQGGKFSLSNVARLFITEVSNSAMDLGLNLGMIMMALVAGWLTC